MKRTLLFLVLLFAITSLTLNAQVKCGIKIGADFSTLKYKIDGMDLNDSLDLKGITTPRLGFFVEIPFTDEIFMQAGFEGALKGYSYKDEREKNGEWVPSDEKVVLVALNFPIMAGYKYDLGDAKVFGMLGPVIGINTYATNIYKAGGKWDNTHMFIGDYPGGWNDPFAYFERLDIGGRIEAGVEIHRFQFSASYTQGLTNLHDLFAVTSKSKVIGLNAAIKFGSVGKKGRWR